MALTDLFDASSGGGSGGGGDIASMLLPLILGGASTGLSALLGGGINKQINQANKAQSNVIDATVQGGANQVKAAQAGQLTPAQQAEVDQMKREQNARNAQMYATLGIPTSTMSAQSQNEVDQNALAFANKLINDSFNQGIQAMQLGNAAANSQLQNAMAQKKDLTSTISGVAQQIGKVLGTPSGPVPTAGQPGNVSVPISMQTDTGFGNDPYANLMTTDQT